MKRTSKLIVLTASLVASALALPTRQVSLMARNVRRQDQSTLTTMYTNCVNSTDVLLTFDDGPSVNTAQLITELDNEQVPGTFLLNGNNYDCIYNHVDELRQAFQSGKGHTFASHSWSHADFTVLTDEEVVLELKRVKEAFDKILGIRPHLFRFPHGNYDERVLGILAQRQYTGALFWSLDSQDASTTPISIDEQIQIYQIQADLGILGGAITLNHDPHDTTVQSLVPAAINIIRKAGLNIVNAETCLGIETYSVIREPSDWATPNDTWTCES